MQFHEILLNFHGKYSKNFFREIDLFHEFFACTFFNFLARCEQIDNITTYQTLCFKICFKNSIIFFSSNFRRFSVISTCFTASRSFLRSALLALFAIFTSVASYMFTFCQLFVYNLQRLGKTYQGRTTSENPATPTSASTTASAASRRAQRRGP